MKDEKTARCPDCGSTNCQEDREALARILAPRDGGPDMRRFAPEAWRCPLGHRFVLMLWQPLEEGGSHAPAG